MISRCYNINHHQYIDYGARGITVFDEWLDVRRFLEYAEYTYPNIEGYTLDRIDNDKGYSPDNCRGASKSEQSANQRTQVTNTSGYTGVSWDKNTEKWNTRIYFNKVKIYCKYFKTVEEAVEARDNYIIENNLPHKLNKLKR